MQGENLIKTHIRFLGPTWSRCFSCKCPSTKCKAEIHRDGGVFVQDYKYGIAQQEIQKIGKTEKNRNKINFTPDYDIFIGQEYEFQIVEERLREPCIFK